MSSSSTSGGGERVRLADVIGYDPQKYLQDDEVALIQQYFKGDSHLIKILRKIFIPTLNDEQLPIEQMGQDAWMTRNWDQIPADEAKILMVARQDALKFIIGGLINLKVIANGGSVDTPMEAALKRSKDSTK